MRAPMILVLLVGCGTHSLPGDPPRPGAAETGSTSVDLVAELRSELESGRTTASRALLSPRYERIRDEREFRRLMRDHLDGPELDLVSAAEPGVSLVVTGTVKDVEGRPIPGALILVYQTDARGWYGVEASDDDEHPRIFGFLRTGPDGRYRYRTVRPGPYAHAPRTATHIHYHFRAEGYQRARGQGPPSLFFSDDPLITAADRAEIADDGAHIAKVEKLADGSQRCVYDLVMRKE